MSRKIINNILGVGSPIIDMNTFVDDEFITTLSGEKGGMELVDAPVIDELLAKVSEKPVKKLGGAAANTIFALSRLDVPTSFLGMIGEDDDAEFYRSKYSEIGGNANYFKTTKEAPTARCLNMITPDSERTMRTDLGAAAHLSPDIITGEDFKGADHVHIEGYLLFNRDLIIQVLKTAKQSNCTVSFDLGSFEVVNAGIDILPELLENYVDLVFANEEETEAYCKHTDYIKAAKELSRLCEVAAVKLGKDGSIIASNGDIHEVDAIKVDKPVDTTGAGDYWAAGFLFGYQNGDTLDQCAKLGAELGGEVVKHIGSGLSDEGWNKIKEKFIVEVN
jgi:sugar/nucleoside kinase (ribokinase family)